MAKISDILTSAAAVRNETAAEQNSALRVGNVLYFLAQYLQQYTSIADIKMEVSEVGVRITARSQTGDTTLYDKTIALPVANNEQAGILTAEAFSTIKADIAELQEAFTDLFNEKEELVTRVNANSENISTLNASLQASQRAIANLSSTLDAAKTEIADNAGNISDLSALIDETKDIADTATRILPYNGVVSNPTIEEMQGTPDYDSIVFDSTRDLFLAKKGFKYHNAFPGSDDYNDIQGGQMKARTDRLFLRTDTQLVYTFDGTQLNPFILSEEEKEKLGNYAHNFKDNPTATGTDAGLMSADDKADFEKLKAEFEKLTNSIGANIEGYVRVSGVSDPQLNFRKYQAEGAAIRPLDVIHPCLIEVGTGKLLHILQNLNFEMDIDGNPRKIDGSEGEVYITNTEPIYHITGHVYVNGVCYDVFLRSLFPFTWQGKKAERIEPFGLSPDNCVAHKDEDGVTRMHSAYNPEWNGSYQAMNGLVGKFVYNGVGDAITESYDENGAIFGGAGGLHTTNLALNNGEQYAMNLNSDRTKSVPFYNEHAKALEVMLGHIIAEGGTFDAHNSALMGSGFNSNDTATFPARWEASDNFAVNGVRYLGGDGSTTRYVALNKGGFLSASIYICIAQMLNDWRSPWRIMERQRVMFYAIQNNIPELTWFAFEGNKYKWRHVDGFAGPSEGALTCVVWKMFSSKFGAGTVDPTGGASLEGHRVDFLVCGAMYRGWSTDVSPSRWVSGLIFTEDSNGLYKAYYQPVQSKLVISNASENTDSSTTLPFETAYDLIGEIQDTFEGYRKDYNDHCLFLAKDTDSAKGANLHTYIGAYNWFNGGKANAGTRSVRGFRRGHVANDSNLSPFAMFGYYSPSFSSSIIGFGTCVQVDTVNALVE